MIGHPYGEVRDQDIFGRVMLVQASTKSSFLFFVDARIGRSTKPN
jgi:hypothetical protein